MCGICGQFNFARSEPVGPETIRQMAGTIVHRGPDDEGYFVSGLVGLGFRRLSIIDLAGGHQPMSDTEESVWLIFNGEIYNYKELRADVQKERLVLARDAMGIKLVYYRIANGQLTFGSEIRAITAAENSKPTVDPLALNLFLRFRYTPSPLTIFDGIRKLAPGTMLIVEDGQYREEPWYDYTPIPFSDPKDDEEVT